MPSEQSDFISLNFVVDRIFMKLFKTTYCQTVSAILHVELAGVTVTMDI